MEFFRTRSPQEVIDEARFERNEVNRVKMPRLETARRIVRHIMMGIMNRQRELQEYRQMQRDRLRKAREQKSRNKELQNDNKIA